MAGPNKSATVEVLIRDEVTAEIERARARLRAAAANNEIFAGLSAGFAGLESDIQSLTRTVQREFGTLLRLTGASGFLGVGLVAGIDRAAQAITGLTRAAEQNRYLADEIGLTGAQLANMTARGQALGMTAEQSKAGIVSLANAMRELKMLGQDSAIYKALDQAGGASGRGLGDELIAAVRGPGGYEAGIRQFAERMSHMNADAQSKLSEIFNLGSIAFRDLYMPGENDLPTILDLAGPQARRLNIAMASLNITFDMLDQFLQGPGGKLVQQFADWASTLKIPWDAIAKNLVGAIQVLIDIFGWGKKTAGELKPDADKPNQWGPILRPLAKTVLPGFVKHLLGFANALAFVGAQKGVIDKISAAYHGGGETTPPKPGSPLFLGEPQVPQRMGRAEDDQLPMAAQPVSFMSGQSGYVIPGYPAEQDDDNQLSAQVKGTEQEISRLGDYVSSLALLTDPTGAGGLAGLAGQIRTGRIGPAGTRIGGGRGGGGGTRGGGGGDGQGPPGIPDSGDGQPTKGVTPEGMAMLDTIATREAEPAFLKTGERAGWNTMVGGERFNPNTDEHPKRAYPGMHGYVGGAGRSYASGRYQETINTYYENVARSKRLHPGMKVTGWSPEAQNLRNWDKAQDVYRRNYRNLGIPSLTGDFQKDLEANRNNPEILGRMSRTLSGEWTSAPGGHERSKQTGGKESYYATTYLRMLARTSKEPQPTSTATSAATPSPIVWSNQDDIEAIERERSEQENLPVGGYTPIPVPGRSSNRINLNINVRGRSARVSSASSGDMGSATISRDKDPSGGIAGFSPG
jgi:muramidase (phage lysozyme)